MSALLPETGRRAFMSTRPRTRFFPAIQPPTNLSPTRIGRDSEDHEKWSFLWVSFSSCAPAPCGAASASTNCGCFVKVIMPSPPWPPVPPYRAARARGLPSKNSSTLCHDQLPHFFGAIVTRANAKLAVDRNSSAIRSTSAIGSCPFATMPDGMPRKASPTRSVGLRTGRFDPS
jgi:hypothetical protein